MTDRELLELAAKAAGVDGKWAQRGDQHWGLLVNHANGAVSWWNPLLDDGDALRLANRTGTCIEFGYCLDDAPIVRCGRIEDRDHWPQECNFPDPGKATRRTIVEAAARAQQDYEAATAGVTPTFVDLATGEPLNERAEPIAGVQACPRCLGSRQVGAGQLGRPCPVCAHGVALPQAPSYFCNKCGYFGPESVRHQRPNGTGECGYLAAPMKPTDGVRVAPHETFSQETPAGSGKAGGEQC